MEREACVCDHGFERSDLCAEIIMEMSRLTRDGTAESISRDQILRHARGQGNIIFPVQLTTSRIGNLTRLIHTLLYVMTIHTYIHTEKNEKTKKTQRKS